MRSWVAQNPNSPSATLTKLAEDEDADVRYWVAKNPNTPARVLFEMAKTETDEIVLETLKNNPNYSTDRLVDEFVDV